MMSFNRLLTLLITAFLISSCSISKKEIDRYLTEINIHLTQPYKKIDSDWSVAIGDMIVKFMVQIDTLDLERLINQIKSQDNFVTNESDLIKETYDKDNIRAYRLNQFYYYEVFRLDSLSGYEKYAVKLDTINKTLNLIYNEE